MPDWELREATDDDRDFLFRVHCAAIRESVEALWGWDEELQLRIFDERFPRDPYRVIQVDGGDAGVLVVEELDDEVFLKLIELLPEAQGQGIGSSIIRSLQARGKPVTLRVLTTNPRAAALYQRLGFRVTERTPERLFMRAEPTSAAGASS
ncbi:MAG TPA: GNAT family N-acetyltransferase [Gaiellaceae bacterium]|nr:GNAT family N-acetyltransferase [Gaiellaceae bacterium]